MTKRESFDAAFEAHSELSTAYAHLQNAINNVAKLPEATPIHNHLRATANTLDKCNDALVRLVTRYEEELEAT